MTFTSHFPTRIFFGFLFLAIVVAPPAIAQPATIDTTFNAIPSNALANDVTFRQIIQPDGKVIVYGGPSMFVNGVQRSGIFRLNTDGSTDTSFVYNNDGGVGISNLMLAPDGKIVVAGTTSPNHAKMVRLNPDGSLDNSFSVVVASSGSPEITGTYFTVNAIQPDGKVIATRTSWGNIMGTWYSYGMARYNLDASVDMSFSPPSLDGGHLVSTSSIIAFLPDGRFYLGISSGSHLGTGMTLTRRLANGSVDSSFTQFSRSLPGGYFISFSDLAVTTDGGVLATGTLWPSMLGSPGQPNLFKFLPSGSFDPAFTSPNVYSGGRIHLLPDGKVLYSASGGSATSPLVRLNANGSIDTTYVLDPAVTGIKNSWQVDPSNRVVFLAQTAAGPRLVRLLEDGSIDSTFNPVLGLPGTVSLLAAQADGKIVVAGAFSQMNGTARNKFARLNADGSLDTSFNPGTAFDVSPRAMLVQPDGKILAVGDFVSYNGTPVSKAVRINSDGTLDNTFSVVVSGDLDDVALQADGKILIGGFITTVNTVGRTGIARLESNGVLDTTFNPQLGGSGGSGRVSGILPEPNGKITIVGSFTGVNGADRNYCARLEANGATDMSFNANFLSPTRRVRQLRDGKYVALSLGFGVLRLNVDGSRDSSFTSPSFLDGNSSGTLLDVLLMPDGSMIVVGQFTTVNGASRRYITRLRSNGAHDLSFLSTGANARVDSIVSTQNGKVTVAGIFSSIENVGRLGITRLNVPALQPRTPFDFDGDGRADISVVRTSANRWYEAFSSTNEVYEETFGLAGDILTPADYDGDGVTDESIYRPSNGQFWYRSSVTGELLAQPWGISEDIPRPSDFDGDGKADFVVFRPSNSTWYRLGSAGSSSTIQFGIAGDQPLVGDFDGDGKGDPAVFRPSSGDWWYAASSAGGAFRTGHWGQNGDIPVPADFDGDGKTDFAVYRPSEGGWYIYNSGNGSFTIAAFGLIEDRPVAADYDGDGRADIAVFRPSTGVWYLQRSTSGFLGYQFGISTDTAIPGSFIP